MNVNVAVKATVKADGSVACDVTCDGQEIRLVFTGTDVFIDVPEPAQDPA